MKTFKLLCAALLVVFTSCKTEEDLAVKAEKLQRSILTIDTHVDTPMRLYRGADMTIDNPTGTVDFPKMREGALDSECFAVFTSQRSMTPENGDQVYARSLEVLQSILDLGTKHPNEVEIAKTPSDLYDIKAAGKLSILPTVENMTIIGEDLTRIEELYNKGVRMFGLCHSQHNQICDSSSDKEPKVFGGLSPLGEQVVAEANRLGGLIDISHASDESFMDVIELSKTPIIASHSSVRAIANHDRNLSDDMLLALKENGGVIQICILDDYVKTFPKNPEYDAKMAAIREEYYAVDSKLTAKRDSLRKVMADVRASYPDQNATISDYVDHIDYVVNKIGIDHVGIGTDFDGGGGISDCKDVSELIGITEELLKRGYSDEDITKIWSGNFVRIFNEAIDYSKSLGSN